MTTSTPALASQRQWFGHPVGLYVCFFTEMWERFAFYGLKALLFLYLTKHCIYSFYLINLKFSAQTSAAG